MTVNNLYTTARRLGTDILRAVGLVWRACPHYTLVVGFLALVQGCLPALQLWLSKLLFDTVAVVLQGSTSDDLPHLLWLVGGQGVLLLSGNLLGLAQETTQQLLGDLLSNQIRIRILEKTNSLELSFFENEKFYNQLQNAFQEAGQRPLEIVNQLLALAQTLITLGFVIFLLARLHWGILFLIGITTLPVLLVQFRYGHQNYWMLRQRAPELRKQNYFGMLLSSDWFIKEIRVFKLEKYFLDLYQTLFTKFFGQTRNFSIKRNVYSILASTISISGWLIASGYLAFQIIGRIISVGDFALCNQAISLVQSNLQILLGGISRIYANALFLNNLFEFLSLPARDPSIGNTWMEPIDEIEFQDVSFCYPGSERIVLQHINFKIQRGQSLALVGKNGAGKTTIAKLLCRLYEPTSGKILVNGKDITNYSSQSVQEQIAILFQDYGHYYLSARENIGVGRISNLSNMAAIQSAAFRSGADEVIDALPDKYESMLGKWFEDGFQLSGGEWQKIALARAFLRGGKVLILDEPTASLDAESEYEIFEDLVNNGAGQIKLLISHRFSTVRMAEHILVIDSGSCIEAGSHEELMRINGQYAHLFKLQARGYETSA